MPQTATDLFRAIRHGSPKPFDVDGEPAGGLLYPRFEDSTYIDSSGQERTSPADVVIKPDEKTKELKVQPGGGTSMFDVRGWFGYTHWSYFGIPNGTEYPEGLYIRRGKKIRKNRTGDLRGRHYQIEPKNPMTVEAFKGALDNFARNAVVQRVELGQSE